jgi:glycosyltransferase involved in cell wall biosynthesis
LNGARGEGDDDGGGPARRVAVLSDWCLPRRGGIETHILALARHLRQAGVAADILTCFPGPDEIEGVRIERITAARLPLAGIAVSPLLVGTLRRRLAAGGYDIVHLHPSQVAPFCLAASVAADRLGLPVVATFHSLMGVLAPVLRMAERLSGWPPERVAMTGVSSLVAGQVEAAMPGRRVGVLPNGFDADFWGAVARADDGTGGVRLVSAMRLQRRKRPFALLDIFAQALELAGPAGGGATLTVAGDGPLRERLERHAARQGLADRVIFAGWLGAPGLRDLYARSDLFAMPSTHESFCIAALEARAAGLPVLGMARTGMRDFIRDGGNGELAADDADMARRLARLLADRAALARLAADGEGLSPFRWETVVARHLDVYREVAAASRSGST